MSAGILSYNSTPQYTNAFIHSVNGLEEGCDCSVIGNDINNLIIGICGYTGKWMGGYSVVGVICSVCSGVFVLVSSIFNKFHNIKEEKKLVVPEILKKQNGND